MKPKSAAAVILMREKTEVEVFWVRRDQRMAFQGGFYAFPGGQQEDPGEDMRECAARELFEETGVKVDPAALIDVGRWVTPAFSPRRYDTCFFLARLPDGQEPGVLSRELEFGEWIRPKDAVAQWRAGSILVAPPILHAMRTLAGGLQDIEARMKSVPYAQGIPTPEIEMRPGINLVPLRSPTRPPATHTNCYLLGGEELIVVDPGSPYYEEQDVLDSVLQRLTAEGRRIREIWLTHLHPDHWGGASHLSQRWDVPIAAHPITAEDLRGVVPVERFLEDDERVDLDGDPGWRFRVMHTPGHARGHVCVFEEKNGSLLSGDLIVGLGTVVIDPPEGNMRHYFDSLRRMLALPVTALFGGHGPVIGPAKEKIEWYIRHRIEREGRIVEAYQKGIREPAAIVKLVYADVPENLHALAERSVVAHLDKLREDGEI